MSTRSIPAPDHPAFAVVFGFADAALDLDRPVLGEDGGARVALLLGDVPIRGVGQRPELLNIVRLGPGLLEAENVGAFRGEVVQEVLAEDRPEAVDVPG